MWMQGFGTLGRPWSLGYNGWFRAYLDLTIMELGHKRRSLSWISGPKSIVVLDMESLGRERVFASRGLHGFDRQPETLIFHSLASGLRG